MSTSLHVKFEHSEAVQGKKQMLLLQKNILETSEHVKNLGDLRKKYSFLENKMRVQFSLIHKEIQSIENTFPNLIEKTDTQSDLEVDNMAEKPKQQKITQIKKRKEITREIDEISAKLAALG